MKLLGSVSGQVVMGVTFDSYWVYWHDECGDRGDCYTPY